MPGVFREVLVQLRAVEDIVDANADVLGADEGRRRSRCGGRRSPSACRFAQESADAIDPDDAVRTRARLDRLIPDIRACASKRRADWSGKRSRGWSSTA